MKRALSIAVSVVGLACEGPQPYCGGIVDPLVYEMSLSELSPELDMFVPVQGELCAQVPLCECVSTDVEGRIRVEVPRETDLLAEIRAPGYLTTLLCHTSGDIDRVVTLRVLDRDLLTIIGGAIGERIDRTAGQLIARAGPAEGADVTGTVFALHNLDTGEDVRVYYTSSGVPSADPTSSDDTGIVFGVNVPPGSYELRSDTFASCGIVDAGWPRYDAEGRLQALAVEVRAGQVTLVDAQRCYGP